MKKILLILFALVLFTGCTGNQVTNVSNPDEVVIDFGTTQMTRGQLYHMMLFNSPVATVEQIVSRMLLDELVPMNDEHMARARLDLEEIMEHWYNPNDPDAFLNLLIQVGFESIEDYFLRVIVPAFQHYLLSELYVTEIFDQLVEEHMPVKVQVIELRNEPLDVAYSLLEELESGLEFEQLTELFLTARRIVDNRIVTQTFDRIIPAVVFDAIEEFGEVGFITSPVVDEGTGNLFVVQIIENDPANMFDELVEYFADRNEIANLAFAHFVRQRGFRIFDIVVFEAFLEDRPQLLD